MRPNARLSLQPFPMTGWASGLIRFRTGLCMDGSPAMWQGSLRAYRTERRMEPIATAIRRTPNAKSAFSASPTPSISAAAREQRRQELAAEAKRAYFEAIRKPAAFQCDTCRDVLTADEMRYRLDDIMPTGGGTDAMVIAARVFVANPRGILTLHGGSGNAKTVVLQAVVNECLMRGGSAGGSAFSDLA